ncbi:MAG: trimethylamine methyltransferase family protein [Candidatus Bathyarchaeia archaeon]
MKAGVRKVKNIRVFSDEELEQIHILSLDLLEDIGVKVLSKRALEILESAGAYTNWDKGIAKIPRYIVEEALRKTPKSVTLYSRNPALDLHLDGVHFYSATDGTGTGVIDLETGKRRPPCKADVAKTALIADYLEYINSYYPTVTARDVPLHSHVIHEFEAALNNTEKHFICGSMDDPKAVPFMVNIMAAILGGEDEVKKRPIMSSVACMASPLIVPYEAIEPSLELAKYNVPIIVMTMPIPGANAPVTVAGSVLIGNAQVLAGITILQLAKPGTPVLYSSYPLSQDMKRGAQSVAFPEAMLITAGHISMAKYYGVPSFAGGTVSSSKLPDAQAAYEKSLNGLFSGLVGVDVGAGTIGLIENYNTLCYEQMIIDYEIYTMILKLLGGIEVNDETLAFEAIRRVGIEGNYLTDKHTIAHFKETWLPLISDARPYYAWLKNGGKSVAEVAKEKVIEILKTHTPPKLDEDVKKEISEIVKKADEELLCLAKAR